MMFAKVGAATEAFLGVKGTNQEFKKMGNMGIQKIARGGDTQKFTNINKQNEKKGGVINQDREKK